MTNEDIIRMAEETGINWDLGKGPFFYFTTNGIERFAALLTAEKDKEIERLREALHDISISQNSMYQEARAKQALGEDQNIWRMCGVNTDDVIKMADEAGIVMSLTDERVTLNKLNRFLELHLKALKNEGYRQCAEGQRTTQYCGLLDAAVKAEREACLALVNQGTGEATSADALKILRMERDRISAAIRARGEQGETR